MTDRGDGKRRASVVVVNPDADVCEVLARLTEAAGHDAMRVTDVDTAISAVAGGADAIVIDAGAANLGLVTAVRAQDGPDGNGVRILTVSTGPASARLAWHAGADGVLARPFPASEIGQLLAAALASNTDERASVRAARLAALQMSRVSPGA